MTAVEVAELVEEYVRTQFRVSPNDTRFSRSQRLFEMGYVDSVGVVELLTFLSERFQVHLPDEVITDDEFSTIDGIARIVVSLRNQGNRAVS